MQVRDWRCVHHKPVLLSRREHLRPFLLRGFHLLRVQVRQRHIFKRLLLFRHASVGNVRRGVLRRGHTFFRLPVQWSAKDVRILLFGHLLGNVFVLRTKPAGLLPVRPDPVQFKWLLRLCGRLQLPRGPGLHQQCGRHKHLQVRFHNCHFGLLLQQRAAGNQLLQPLHNQPPAKLRGYRGQCLLQQCAILLLHRHFQVRWQMPQRANYKRVLLRRRNQDLWLLLQPGKHVAVVLFMRNSELLLRGHFRLYLLFWPRVQEQSLLHRLWHAVQFHFAVLLRLLLQEKRRALRLRLSKPFFQSCRRLP